MPQSVISDPRRRQPSDPESAAPWHVRRAPRKTREHVQTAILYGHAAAVRVKSGRRMPTRGLSRRRRRRRILVRNIELPELSR